MELRARTHRVEDATGVETEVLRALTPIGQLAPEALHEVSRCAQVRGLRAGQRIFAAGENDDWTWYVLDGTVRLQHRTDSFESVAAGSPAAQLPIAPHRPRRASAAAATDARLLRIPTSLLEVLSAPARSGPCEVAEIDEDDERLEHRLLHQVVHDFMHDRLEVPVLPDVALRIREAVSDPDVGTAALGRIVASDPAVAARVVRVANSAAYRGHAAVENCFDAITRLGLQVTQELVTALALKQLFASRSSLIERRMREVWQHSTRVGAISFALGSKTPGISPDRALLAGLVHDIGAVTVLARAEQFPELVTDRAQLDETLALLAGQVGAMILRAWDFPGDVATAAAEADDWMRDPGPKADYCDVVLVAQLLSFMGTTVPSGAAPPRVKLSKVPAVTKLAGGDLTGERCLEILAEAEQTITDLQSALS